jgi:hypothetical protein
MALDHIKSPAITNLDASPIVPVTTGEGAMGYLKEVSGYATAQASSTIQSTYQFCRVPSNCKIKSIIFESAAQTAGSIALGLYYATDGGSGPSHPLALSFTNTNSVISSTLFSAATSAASAVVPTEMLTPTTFTIDLRQKPLWSAAGLTTDPGGFFDIVGTVTTTAVTTGLGVWGISVRYTE